MNICITKNFKITLTNIVKNIVVQQKKRLRKRKLNLHFGNIQIYKMPVSKGEKVGEII